MRPTLPPATRGRRTAFPAALATVALGAAGVALAAALAATLAACGVEYRPGKSGADSARAVAALDSARRADARVDTVTVVRVDTVLVRDTLPPLGPAGDSAASPGIAAGALPSVGPVDVPPVPLPNAPPGGPPNARPGAPSAASADPPAVTEADLARLASAGLRVPVRGVRAAQVPDTFNEGRDGGARGHQALDILAPRGTPVVSAAGGRVLKLFTSTAGGLTVYVLDPAGRFVYYYAHLDAYRPGLAEGQTVRAGDVLGAVGATGNANAAAPHLHFAVARVGDPRRWWAGTPVDPRPYLRD